MKKLLTALVIIVSLGTAGSVCAADFAKGWSAYKAGDYATALKEWTVLAEQGDTSAQYNLGRMSERGEGVVQDYKETVKWWRKSAEQGVAVAQYDLGRSYGLGNGVIQDDVYAHMWFNVAASNGYKNAVKGRNIAAKNMTAADISKAQGLARACVAKKYKGC